MTTIGTKIYPVKVPQNVLPPSMRLYTLPITRHPGFGSGDPLRSAELQIDIFTETRDQGVALRKITSDRLERWRPQPEAAQTLIMYEHEPLWDDAAEIFQTTIQASCSYYEDA